MKTQGSWCSRVVLCTGFFTSAIVFASQEPGSLDYTSEDDEATNWIEFSAKIFHVKETQSNAWVEVVRQVGSTGAVSVAYETEDQTAEAERDYVTRSGTIAFAEGQYTNWFLVPIINTPQADGNRSATLRLREPTGGGVLGGQSNATLAILDDESPAVITELSESWLRAAALGGGDVICKVDGTITLSDPIEVSGDLTITGLGHYVVLDGGGSTRLFNVRAGGTLLLQELMLSNGRSTNGGAIFNEGHLVLTDCIFSNNVARGQDGRNGLPRLWLPGTDGSAGSSASGGAILAAGTTWTLGCTFISNRALGGNGGDGGDGSTSWTNYGPGIDSYSAYAAGSGAPGAEAFGGAIASSGLLFMDGARFLENLAQGGSGGRGGFGAKTNYPYLSYAYVASSASGSNGPSADGYGGAIAASNVLCDGCVFSQNVARGGDGPEGVSGQVGTHWGPAFAGATGSAGAAAKGGAAFVSGDGVIVDSEFSQNASLAGMGGAGGRGGDGGRTQDSYHRSDGGAGGAGGLPGNASGGALYAGGTLTCRASSFALNRALGGHGGCGGSGGMAGGNGYGGGAIGAGADGANGGDATGGAIMARDIVSFENNLLITNQAVGGNGGGGGMSGGRSARYSERARTGSGGRGGAGEGGSVFVQQELSSASSNLFSKNVAQGGSGGDGAHGTSFRAAAPFSLDANNGGEGGDGGQARGGACAVNGSAILNTAGFEYNSALGGDGGEAGSGGSSGHNPGDGGSGGRGGDADGGALSVRLGLHVQDLMVTENSATGGKAGAGGNAGTGWALGYYGVNTPGYGGPGGAGGNASGGGLSIEPGETVEIHGSILTDNRVVGGSGGNAGDNGAPDDTYQTDKRYGFARSGGSGGAAQGGSVCCRATRLYINQTTISGSEAVGGDTGGCGTGGPAFILGTVNVPGGPASTGVHGGAADGGGVMCAVSSATVVNCTLNDNRSQGGSGGAGGRRSFSGDTGGMGGRGGQATSGGLAKLEPGNLQVTNCTLYGNSAWGGRAGSGGADYGGAPGGIGGDAEGGAFFSQTGLVVAVNISCAENFVAAGAGGSGGAGTNTVGATGATGRTLGGTVVNDAAAFAILNSLFKHSPGGTNAWGMFTDLGHNISSDTSFAFTEPSSLAGTDPLVGPLADNGGATWTLALLSGSPAIDAGNDAAAPATDQRGVARPFGPHADMGAFELNQPAFRISGRVNHEGHGVPGITVVSGTAKAVSNDEGYFVLRNLLAGSHVVAPQFAWAEFSPETRTITVGPDRPNADFSVMLSRVSTVWQQRSGRACVEITGVPRATFKLETSTNLQYWAVWTNALMDSSGACVIEYPVSTNESQRFFRGR